MTTVTIPPYVRVLPKADTFLRFITRVWPRFDQFWTTYRLPFQKQVSVTYPSGYASHDKALRSGVIAHELVHAVWFIRWWGPLLLLLVTVLPLPILFSGRWFVERPAYLHDIKAGRYTVDQAVDILWKEYAWCWPRAWMRRWFQKQVTW